MNKLLGISAIAGLLFAASPAFAHEPQIGIHIGVPNVLITAHNYQPYYYPPHHRHVHHYHHWHHRGHAHWKQHGRHDRGGYWDNRRDDRRDYRRDRHDGHGYGR